ncbi:MAG: Gfo/Idh/MocA family oxidoreductase [Blastocatellia bacterium]|nr:Gfo/Idh/MocA family oxidoreductase [Blastocatellia bacterium]MDW8257568.1 Gfo/Idh/MocA family oxidoreductase [Acidobacteriota bacterium]
MRFLIVGCGSMGKRRIRNLHQLGERELLAFDPREDRRQEVAARYGVAVFSSFEEALAQEPEALVVSTPPAWHAPYVEWAIRHNRHFFCEVPLSPDPAEIERLERLMQECGFDGVAAPSSTWRFLPTVRLLRELLREEWFAPVLCVLHQVGQYLPDWHPWEDYRTFYAADLRMGGGLDVPAIELSWMLWLLGEARVKRVQGLARKLSRLEIETADVIQLLLECDNGVLLTMHFDMIQRKGERYVKFISEGGTIVWEGRTVRFFRASGTDWTFLPELEPEAVEQTYVEEMRTFLAAIRGEAVFPNDLSTEHHIMTVLRHIIS